MTVQNLDRDIADLANQCGVDAMTVQMAADGVARRLAAMFGGNAEAAAQMSPASVQAALTHYAESMRQIIAQAAADPRQIIALMHAGH